MKYITHVTTFAENTVDNFNQTLSQTIWKYQNNGKEVDVKLGVINNGLVGLVIAYENKERTDNEQE